jgi:hypothetical protein
MRNKNTKAEKAPAVVKNNADTTAVEKPMMFLYVAYSPKV